MLETFIDYHFQPFPVISNGNVVDLTWTLRESGENLAITFGHLLAWPSGTIVAAGRWAARGCVLVKCIFNDVN
jgi:hypothetical protein